MEIKYSSSGIIIPGIYEMKWQELVKEFGYNIHRQTLLSGLKMACKILKKHGCKYIYIGGSFASQKEFPNDFDGCWDPTGVNIGALVTEQPAFLLLTPPRDVQKKIFKGELLLTTSPGGGGKTMLDFFQQDKNDIPRGIIRVNLNTIV